MKFSLGSLKAPLLARAPLLVRARLLATAPLLAKARLLVTARLLSKTRLSANAPILAFIVLCASCSGRNVGDEVSKATDELRSGNVRAALIRAEKVLEKHPENLDARLVRAEAWLREGNVADVGDELQSLESAGADPARVRLLQYQLDAIEGNFETLLAEVDHDAGVLSEDDRARWRVASLAALGRTDDAEAAYRSWLERDPASSEAALGLAALLARTNRGDEAAAVLDRMPASSRDFQYWLVTASVRHAKKDVAGAGAAMTEAASSAVSDPQRYTALLGLVALALEQRDIEKADEAARALADRFEDVPAVSLVRARVALAQRNYGLAASLLEEFRAAQPDNVDAVVLLAAARMLNGQLELAKRHIDAVLTDQPSYPAALRLREDIDFRESMARAVELGQQGRAEEAVRIYDGMLERWPNHPVVLNNLGWQLYEAKDPKALEYARRAYELAPGVPEIADTYGWILAESGRVEEGIAILAEAAGAAPSSAAIEQHLEAARARLSPQ